MTEVLTNRIFYTLIVNPTSAQIHMPKHMVIGQSGNNLSSIVDPEVACKQSLDSNQ